ncbi:MAG: GGDEF domain-containing protein [Rhodoferax sp.]|nr:GGDEF domain-containing protein [Rhodoferax sp.]
MRLGIAVKLGMLLASVGVLASGFTGLYAYQASRSVLLELAKSELLTTTSVVARPMTLSQEEALRQVHLLAEHPAVLAALQGKDDSGQDRVAALFEQIMLANPSYLQMHLVAALGKSRERVRMDRVGGALLRKPLAELQEIDQPDYIAAALRQAAGTPFLSHINIQHEQGFHKVPDLPTRVLSMPVFDSSGQAIGVVAIHVDVNASYASLLADLPSHYQLYLSNGAGEMLGYPARYKGLASVYGKRSLLQDEFAQTAALVQGEKTQLVTEVAEGAHAAAPVVAAFVVRRMPLGSVDERIILGLAVPRDIVLAQSDQLGTVVLQMVAALGVACLVLALVVARLVTRPINSISRAVQRFASEHHTELVGTRRSDEIGTLARRFVEMQDQITAQMRELERSHHEMELLARHDPMTGLPNRRLFQERLDEALARAQRNAQRFAILFIDVDKFKPINDRYGHEAGDQVLKVIAQRMLQHTRKVDTVARMGGDEFVVLLDSTEGQDSIAAFADKLIDNVHQPIPYDGSLLEVGFSVGISQYPDHGRTAHELLSNADTAMYQAKSAGNSGYHFSNTALPACA